MGTGVGHQRTTGAGGLVGEDRYPRHLAKAMSAFGLGLVSLSVLAWALPRPRTPGAHFGWILVIALLQSPIVVVWWFHGHRWPRAARVLIGVTTVVTLPIVVALAGPRYQETVVLVAVTTACMWVFLSRRMALVIGGLSSVSYLVVLSVQGGHAAPAVRWVIVVGVSALAAGVLVWIFARIEGLAGAEAEARRVAEVAQHELERANEQLAELNATLGQRVEAQVCEIEGLNRMRRFLSTPVADAVFSGEGQALLEPHRRRIAVLFCDLRGFTAFSSSAQPEEVGDVLTEYFELLGAFVTEYQATVGAFTGDGIMAFINDPLPVEQPALRAISMAAEICSAMDDLRQSWELRGYDLGFGVGVAYGYANIGMIGFEGRRDYSALGPVVNLAARLCAEAADGEILVDAQAHAAAADAIEVRETSLHIKGFTQPVAAFAVQSVRDLQLNTMAQLPELAED